ncbi:hypothetical protein BGZ73_000183 [Actinomortierella ambigua]|nr:hypothetical protein BGZ73_000183 [Actinomortierella ambigua]
MASLSIGNFIGAGGYGSVYHARWGTRKVAIKKFAVTHDEALQATDIQQEIALLERLRDRHIIQFYGKTFHEDKLVLVMDYADGGSLQRAIKRRRLGWPDRMRIAQEIIQGLAYIHHENILHRDLKSANVLLTRHMEVKLCDFGLAVVKVQSASKSTGDSLKGTLRWMAPELFAKRPRYTSKSDIYALGMVMWEMAANDTMPFKEHVDNAMIAHLISRGEREDLPDDTPSEYRLMVERCWEHDPEKRPEASELIMDDVESEAEDDGAENPATGDSVTISMEFSSIISMASGETVVATEDSEKDKVDAEDDHDDIEDVTDLYGSLSVEAQDGTSTLVSKAGEGDVASQVALAEMYEKGAGVEQSDAEAFKWYLAAAQQGDSLAQHKTGDIYWRGRGTEQNNDQAALWFKKAADQGHSVSQFDLGAMYEAGEGVEKDLQQAMALYVKAATLGNTEAQFRLGEMYEYGVGVKHDTGKAMQWYRKAALQGHVFAQYQTAMMYSLGMGVDKNHTEALGWFRMAAEQGDMNSQYSLGRMYQQGDGVVKDSDQAIHWYKKAAEQGHGAAGKRVKRLTELAAARK